MEIENENDVNKKFKHHLSENINLLPSSPLRI